MRFIKLFSLQLFFLLLFLFSARVVRAADFAFDYLVNYDVLGNGSTSVLQKVTVTNLTSTVYAQNYTLSIASEKISDVRAKDNSGIITPLIAQGQGQTVITIPFNVISAGIDKKFEFEISYVSGDIAKKIGRVWEIIIPGLEKSEDVRSYTITLSTPADFPSAAYFSPQPKNPRKWAFAEHRGKGVTAAFGDYQRFDFNLNYHLENTSSQPHIQEITLPSDNAFQKIIISNISTLPQNVTVDADGNWLAKYKLAKNSAIDIKVDGTALVFVSPDPKAKVDLSQQERETYTKEQVFWEQTEQIKNSAAKYKTPRQIYDYVVDTLEYSYERVTPGIKRLGAKEAIVNPKQAVCMEFSDLFIAIARAAGIPAREIHGFAYTTNSRLQPLSLLTDVLHAWPEYYDESRKLWIPVDPTWGDTTRGIDYFSKLDFNHVAFAVLGEKSDYPYPAGAFRKSSSNKDVFVDFSVQDIQIPTPKAQVELSQSKFISGQNTQTNLIIKNNSSVLYTPRSLVFNTPEVSMKEVKLDPIPPYGYFEAPLNFSFDGVFKHQELELTAILDDQEMPLHIAVTPFYQPYLPFLLFLLVIPVILLVYVKRVVRKT